MLSFNSAQKIYLTVEHVDMRKQFNVLCAMAAERLKENPINRAMFCFTNKHKDRVKILFCDGIGFWF
jgi:transposase